jgi:hypothetical protein
LFPFIFGLTLPSKRASAQARKRRPPCKFKLKKKVKQAALYIAAGLTLDGEDK